MPIRYHVFVTLLLCLGLYAPAQDGFVENKGQWPEHVRYRTPIPSGACFVEDQGFTFQLVDPVLFEFMHPASAKSEPPEFLQSHVYNIHFVGGTIDIDLPQQPSGVYFNYFVGNDPSKHASEAYEYNRIVAQQVYSGIDMRITTRNQGIKYDWIVRNGGNPADIVTEYLHTNGIEIVNGELIVHTCLGNVEELQPYAYQYIGGSLVEVPCAWVVDGNIVSFDVGEYDPQYDLVIDPEVTFSSYIGSPASNFGFTATDDSNGNLIAGAAVFASNYPTTAGAVQSNFNTAFSSYCDAAISKFNASGTSLLYSTYLGGSGLEMPHSIIADSQDNYIVMGQTGSDDFPTTGGSYQPNLVGGPEFSFGGFFIPSSHLDGCDIYVAKFNANGTGLLGCTYVGGFGTDGLNTASGLFYNYGDSFRGEVIVDDQDRIVVASTTHSNQFPTTPGAPQTSYGGGFTDAVLFRLSADLSDLEFSTYFGGNGADSGYSVQINSNGQYCLTGGSRSDNLPTTNNADDPSHNGDTDGYITLFNSTLTGISGCTYVGTTGYDQCYFVQMDASDFIYVIGQTDGAFSTFGNVYENNNSGQFIRKYNADLSDALWSTRIGTGSGEIDISPTAFLVSECDQIYFSGWGGLTNSNNSAATSSTTTGMPVTGDAYQSSTDGSDFYLCVLSPDAENLVYATFFGGPVSREHVDGGTSKFDKNGSVYQAVCAGCGGNDDFPYTPGAWSDDNESSNCNLGVFKFDLGSIHAEIDIDGPDVVCEGQPAQFINNSTGGTDYVWTFGDGESSTSFAPVHYYEDFGMMDIMLVVNDATGCLAPDTAWLNIEILQGVNPIIDPVDPICEGASVQLNATGTPALYWINDPTLSATNIPNPVATPDVPTTYYVVDTNDCESDTIGVFVDFVIPNITMGNDETICIGETIQLSASGGVGYSWTPVTTLNNPNSATPNATPLETTTYTVEVTTAEGCVAEDSQTITVITDPPGDQVYPDENICIGNSVMLQAEAGFMWDWYPALYLDDPTSQTPIATPPDTITYFVDISNACGTGTDQVTVNVIYPNAQAGDDGQVCEGDWMPVWASGGVSYYWSPALYADPYDEPITQVSPPQSMDMTVYVTDEYGCTTTASVYVHVLPAPEADAGPDRKLEWLTQDQVFGYAEGIDFWWEPDLYIECTDCLAPLIWPDESMWYYLYTVDENGCTGRDSVWVEVFFPLYVPNTFTPDGDGINDFFRAYGENIQGFSMEIRNRWGELIFTSDAIDKVWDGSVNGGQYYAQNDTYIWTIYYDAYEGREKLVGHVNLVR
ncbi:MAG: gliding motility-associated C-terminal domain-containing protein [Flavobacteriales bacterium]|nr:gliding motility-associated C-terminal domain-containing protein [Flavobacteriales bacterium]